MNLTPEIKMLKEQVASRYPVRLGRCTIHFADDCTRRVVAKIANFRWRIRKRLESHFGINEVLLLKVTSFQRNLLDSC